MSFLNLELALFSVMTCLALWPVLRYGLFCVMANATTHPTDEVLKTIGCLYGKEKKRRLGRWYWGVKKNLEILSVIIEEAVSFIEKSPTRKKIGSSNCWDSGEVS